MSTTLVIGASGTVGSTLVQLLRSRGDTVLEATSRTPQRPGQVALNLLTGVGVKEAVAQAQRAFVLAPPGHVNQHELLGPVIEAARAAGLKKVVLMSAMGANADPSVPLRRAELLLEQSGLAWNIIRPNWFMQNFNSYWIAGIREHGTIALPVADAKGSFIDARDIAAVAAELLRRSDLDNRDFDITGGVALDHTEAAAILSKATGKAIRYENITPEAMRSVLLAAGLPTAYTEFMLVILGYFKAGYAERVTSTVKDITGREPTSFEHYARDHRAAWV